MISENLKAIKERIYRAAEKVGRSFEGITLVCVTKNANIAQIEQAITEGVTDMGESHVQDAAGKFKSVGNRVRWHMIGHLQTNKVNEAVRIFDLIHSVDSLRLAEAISNRAGPRRPKDILIEVKTSEEATKFGVLPEEIVPLLDKLSGLPGIRVRGLMTMAPYAEDPEKSRFYFQRLKKVATLVTELLISDRKIRNITMEYLSMGMSQDFEVAIEEGANILRIGHAIFEN